MRVALLLLFFICSCSSHQKVFHPVGPRTQVFPNGIYQHQITLTLGNSRSQHFSGVVQLKDDLITVVGLSQFGSTLFRITETRATGVIKTEIFLEAFKKYEEKVTQFYKVIRELMLLKEGDTQSQGVKVVETEKGGAPRKVLLSLEDKEIILLLSDFDEHRIPQTLSVTHPSFQVSVRVVGYNV